MSPSLTSEATLPLAGKRCCDAGSPLYRNNFSLSETAWSMFEFFTLRMEANESRALPMGHVLLMKTSFGEGFF